MVSTPETIEDGDLYGKLPTIKFEKDGITIVGVVASGSIDLYTQTMYISKKNRSLATATDEQAPVNTPETTRSTASSNIVSKDLKKSNEIVKKSLKIEVDSDGRKLSEKQINYFAESKIR